MDFFLWKFPMYKRKQPFPVIFAGLFFRFFFLNFKFERTSLNKPPSFFFVWPRLLVAASNRCGQAQSAVTRCDRRSLVHGIRTAVWSENDGPGRQKKDERCAVLEIVHARPAIVKFRPCGIGLAFLAGQCRARLVFSSAKFCLYSVFVAFRYWKGPRVNKTPFVNKGGGAIAFFPGAVRNAGKVCLGGILNSSQVTQQNLHTLVTLAAFFQPTLPCLETGLVYKFPEISEISNRPKMEISKTLKSIQLNSMYNSTCLLQKPKPKPKKKYKTSDLLFKHYLFLTPMLLSTGVLFFAGCHFMEK